MQFPEWISGAILSFETGNRAECFAKRGEKVQMEMYYTATTAMIVVCMLIMLISINFNIGLKAKQKQTSAVLFGLIILGVLCEWCGVMLNGQEVSQIPLHKLVKVIELSFSPFIGLACGKSFGDSKWEKPFFYCLCLNAILEVISAFTGWVFYVDANNIYHHGRFYMIYLIAYILGFAYFMVRGIAISKNFQGNYGLSIMGVVIFAAACIVTQTIDSSIRIDWLAIAMSAIMLYKFHGDMLLQIDGLTALLNRFSYEYTLQNISRKAVVLFFDVDKFKQINDTYGHAFGDFCLQTVVLYRSPEQAEKLNKDFYTALEQKRKKEKNLPSVSYGYAVFDPQTDKITDTMKKADDMMYQYKQANRK